MQGISHDESTEEAKRFTAVSLKLEKAEKAFKMLFGQENTLVPNKTPLFQWRGHIFNKNKSVYRTVEDCLDQFERVLFAHRLGLEENWRRLVPARLSTNMARWYAKCMTVGNFTLWTTFRIAVSNKYGRNQADIKEEAREKLARLLYDKANSFELFIENFQELKAQAEITDEDCLVRYLFKALPQELAQATKFYLNNNADKDEITADFAIKKVVATFEALFKQKWQDEGIMERKKGNFFDKKKTSINKRYREKVSSGASDKSKMICKYHPGLTGHSTENCLMNQDDKKKIDKIFKKSGKDVKFCYTWCKAPNYKKGEHECSGVAKNKKRKTNDKIVPTNMDVDTTDAESETDGENDSHLTFSALAIEDKQDQYNQHCTLKTYFLLDTGASFSCISPALADKLKIKLNKDNFGTIKTCQRDNVVERMGSTEEKIKLIYNSRVCHANLEVFDIFNGLYVVIGMDLITQLGITISNLAMDWDDDNNIEIPPIDPEPYTPNQKQIPPIDPEPYTPNNQPYGTKEERERLLTEVMMPLLEAKKQIDPKSHCTLPGSTLKLHVLEEEKHKMFRAQWPLEEKVKPVVKAQIAKWLENGVIERAPPGNPYNSPLFPVRKKNAQGEYSGDSRVVMDCRLVNSALNPARSDRFPLPLISELHRKMSKHSVYTVVDLSQCFHSFAIHPKSRKYLSFTDPTTGLQVMYAKAPMGLTPLSSFVQRQLTNLFADLNHVTTNFIDDITLTAPLDAIKNVPDITKVWTQEHTTAIKQIQQLMVNAPVLSAPDMAHDIHLVTDSSSAYGIGACLYQVKKKRVYYLGFIARKLTPIDNEWLWGKKFHLYVDNKGLLYLHSQEKLTRMIENFYETIFELDFDITFCAGIHNILADRLSRIFDYEKRKMENNSDTDIEGNSNKKTKLHTNAEESEIANHPVDLKESSSVGQEKDDQQTDQTIAKDQAKASDTDKASNSQDLFIYASHLDIYEQPKNESEKKTLLEKAHLLGHFGVTAMEQVIHEEYQMHWTGLLPAIREQIVKTKEADNAYFKKRHKILEKPFPVGSSVMIKNVDKNKKTDPNYEGPYSVYGYTKNGSYILQDKSEAFLSRDIPTSHIKLISEEGILPEEKQHVYVVESILNHKGEAPNHEYLVRWEGYDSSWDSWEPPSMFDDKKATEETYWSRRNAGQSTSKKGKRNILPKSSNQRKIESRQEKSVRRKARIAAVSKK
ncbi:hypothetical protein HMPREF1544_01090 [Mucor circinelloides 1006PhL]|uniref:Chromo domain-containing protein n=1 Tax=Mucor circinelloides f. circinelloides (strain 1006PhL) TaxID=1220926 RepID=S2JUA8_MUCC1|nr:hypothetical protein HMPREF1544_01090 [Mucor circinelloides 1006PhL]